MKGDGWEMLHGRWEDVLPKVEAGVAICDHTISDPPFTAKVSLLAKQREGLYSRQAGRVEPKAGAGTLSFDGVEASQVGPVLVPLARRWTVLFCAIEQIGHYADSCPEFWVRGCWWAKTNGTPQFTGDRPGTPGEALAVLHAPGKKRWNAGGKVGEWRGGRINHGSQWDSAGGYRDSASKLHETQKPLWLMRQLIEDFTDPGDLVLDPYAGSGTTGVACLLTGRRFLGVEMQERYYDIACERLQAAEKGQTLEQFQEGQVPMFGGAS